jgi:hypothetical protein
VRRTDVTLVTAGGAPDNRLPPCSRLAAPPAQHPE